MRRTGPNILSHLVLGNDDPLPLWATTMSQNWRQVIEERGLCKTIGQRAPSALRGRNVHTSRLHPACQRVNWGVASPARLTGDGGRRRGTVGITRQHCPDRTLDDRRFAASPGASAETVTLTPPLRAGGATQWHVPSRIDGSAGECRARRAPDCQAQPVAVAAPRRCWDVGPEASRNEKRERSQHHLRPIRLSVEFHRSGHCLVSHPTVTNRQ
jgi:hypothetical protein